MIKNALQALLLAAWSKAANSKDQVEERTSQLSSILALLTQCHNQPWFEEIVADQIKSTYPKPHRCLLDAVLQAFVAMSPLHAGPILSGFLKLPGCSTFNSPFRRDLVALFKAPTQLQSCWPQQGVVVCSIVAYLAAAASKHLWEIAQQPQMLHMQLHQQHLGTAVGWLVDCFMHAVPGQLLPLMQLVLATAVSQITAWTAQMQSDHSRPETRTPPAKKLRLAQQQQQQQATEAVSNSSSTGPNQQAAQLGMQLLTAVCCCENVQHNSRRLIPYAAAAAASAAVGTVEQAVQAIHHTSWLYRHLCLQLTAAPLGSAAAPAPAAAPIISSSSGMKQDSACEGLQPSIALVHVLRQLVELDPVLVLELVHALMGLPSRDSARSAALNSQQMPMTAHAGSGGSSSRSSSFSEALVQAARQWRPVADAAVGQSKKQKGKKGPKHQQQNKQAQLQQQVPVLSSAGNGASLIQAPALPLKQVMPAAPNVSATWVCKQVVPVLVELAREHEGEQQQQQELDLIPSSQVPPAAAALVQMLSVKGMLLPAAGEVLVSARVLGEALNLLTGGFQHTIATEWRLQLQQQALPAASGEQRRSVVPWKELQPMLCLLSSLELTSPIAHMLVDCVQGCVDSSPAEVPDAQRDTSSNSAREVLQHVLLPVRFGLKMPARVWLLQQLLMPEQHAGGAAAVSTAVNRPLPVDSTAGQGISPAGVVLTALERLLAGDWQKQLAQGLHLLAKQQQGMSVGHNATSLQQAQGVDLATAVAGLIDALDGSHGVASGVAADSPDEGGRQLQVAQQLRLVVQAADAAAYDAVMLKSIHATSIA